MATNDLKLLRALDSKNLSPEVMGAFFSKGKAGYDLLFEQLRSGALTKWQMRNAMELLVRLRLHGDQAELFSGLLELTRDERVEVRAGATQLVMGLTVIAKHRKDGVIKNANRAFVAPFVQVAITRGLGSPDLEANARDFLAKTEVIP